MNIFEFAIIRYANKLMEESDVRKLTPGEDRFLADAEPILSRIEREEATARKSARAGKDPTYAL
jgi:hypothetical protein